MASRKEQRERAEDPMAHHDQTRQRMCPQGKLEPAEGSGSALTRQAFLERALALILGSSSAAALLAGCGDEEPAGDRGMGGGMMDGPMPNWMMSRDGMDPRMARHMRVIHRLLVEHEQIRRDVEQIPGGIRSTTVSKHPEIADLIRTHVRQMKSRVEAGHPIRQMDPVFREIFEHHTKIHLEIDNIPGGARVTETSKDPQVTLLIRQHAREAVSEFVADGMQRAMRPTPLPPGYQQ